MQTFQPSGRGSFPSRRSVSCAFITLASPAEAQYSATFSCMESIWKGGGMRALLSRVQEHHGRAVVMPLQKVPLKHRLKHVLSLIVRHSGRKTLERPAAGPAFPQRLRSTGADAYFLQRPGQRYRKHSGRTLRSSLPALDILQDFPGRPSAPGSLPFIDGRRKGMIV